MVSTLVERATVLMTPRSLLVPLDLPKKKTLSVRGHEAVE